MLLDDLQKYKSIFSEELDLLKRLRHNSEVIIEDTGTINLKPIAEMELIRYGFSIEPFDKEKTIYLFKKKILNGIEIILISSVSFLSTADVLPITFRIKSEQLYFEFLFNNENESFYIYNSDSLLVNDTLCKSIKNKIDFKGVTIKKNEYVFHYANKKTIGRLYFDLKKNKYKFTDSLYDGQPLFEGDYIDLEYTISDIASLLELNYKY